MSQSNTGRGKSFILVGMPGSGKSTLGVLLAKNFALPFVDTDLLIQSQQQCTLQDIIDEHGHLYLRQVEEDVILQLDEQPPRVIATGGSAVYSEKGMLHLKRFGVVVYLCVPLSELQNRIHNYESRGIARAPDQSFESLMAERDKLYRRYADVTLETVGETLEESVLRAQNELSVFAHNSSG